MVSRMLLLIALGLFAVTGCGFNSDHNIHGTQNHEHNVHHDPQRLDIYIHGRRDGRKNPPPSSQHPVQENGQ